MPNMIAWSRNVENLTRRLGLRFASRAYQVTWPLLSPKLRYGWQEQLSCLKGATLMRLTCVVTAVLSLLGSTTFTAAQAPSAKGIPTAAEMQPVIDKAIAYLKAHQDEDGAFSKKL